MLPAFPGFEGENRGHPVTCQVCPRHARVSGDAFPRAALRLPWAILVRSLRDEKQVPFVKLRAGFRLRCAPLRMTHLM